MSVKFEVGKYVASYLNILQRLTRRIKQFPQPESIKRKQKHNTKI